MGNFRGMFGSDTKGDGSFLMLYGTVLASVVSLGWAHTDGQLYSYGKSLTNSPCVSVTRVAC